MALAPRPEIDRVHADPFCALEGACLDPYANLTNCNLSRVLLNRAVLDGAMLNGAVLRDANVFRVDFGKALHRDLDLRETFIVSRRDGRINP